MHHGHFIWAENQSWLFIWALFYSSPVLKLVADFILKKHTMLVNLVESLIVRVERGHHFFTTLYRRSFALHHNRNLDKTYKNENNTRRMFSVHSWLSLSPAHLNRQRRTWTLMLGPAGSGSPRGGVGSCCSKTHLVNILWLCDTDLLSRNRFNCEGQSETSSRATPSHPIHERMLQFWIQHLWR